MVSVCINLYTSNKYGVIKMYWGNGIIYIHDVEEIFCTVPPMNNLGSLYTVLLLFLFYGGIIYFCDGMVSWYLFVSIYLPLIILV